jgi:predicted RecA/RadA family phage recombinase
MARNRKFAEGNQLAVAITSPAAAAAGDPVLVGNLAGVALEPTRAVDGLTAVQFDGVYNLPVANACAVGNLIAGAPGSPVVLTAYANAAAVPGGSIVFGVALAAQAAAGTIAVRLGR